ncbi:TMEM175 family protein [uncultured Dechloromonas sp.]|uniref:TMEM175 family protein n=1 Tax=uncultured Dechloromonas sp. TaxID=171719 RepID=UPI0025D6C490|nr:TMEM175 family protein [uncultured Dechloromonas sp.]
MGKNRLEAFSDGVLAIIITIMVLEMKVPHGESFADLAPVMPVFLSYILSFVYVGIYWNNHHHLLHTAHRVTGRILWANLHLLFWLSLFPFATGWMGENHFAPAPTALYGGILLMAGLAYLLLQRAIIAGEGGGSILQQALGSDGKGKLSILGYSLGVATSFWVAGVAQSLYVAVALMWLIPDRRIERSIEQQDHREGNP